jgi:hypothetical protein
MTRPLLLAVAALALGVLPAEAQRSVRRPSVGVAIGSTLGSPSKFTGGITVAIPIGRTLDIYPGFQSLGQLERFILALRTGFPSGFFRPYLGLGGSWEYESLGPDSRNAFGAVVLAGVDIGQWQIGIGSGFAVFSEIAWLSNATGSGQLLAGARLRF